MTQAHITLEDGQPWLWVTTNGAASGERWCIYEAPVDLSSKARIRKEIDHAHQRTGMPRPDLYDTFRAFQYRRGEKVSRHAA